MEHRHSRIGSVLAVVANTATAAVVVVVAAAAAVDSDVAAVGVDVVVVFRTFAITVFDDYYT